MGWLFLLQEIFPTQGLNPGLSHCGQKATWETFWVFWEALPGTVYQITPKLEA